MKKYLKFEISDLFVDISIYNNAGVAQLVERQPSKLNVAGSNPVSRSFFCRCSSGVERFLGKEEVTSSNLVIGSLSIKVLNKTSNHFLSKT